MLYLCQFNIYKSLHTDNDTHTDLESRGKYLELLNEI